MSTVVAGLLGFIGILLGSVGLLLLSAVVAVALQGKPVDTLSTLIALVLIALAAFALRAAWRRFRAPPA